MASICLSADPVQAIQMKFATKEDAIFFAEKQGFYKTNELIYCYLLLLFQLINYLPKFSIVRLGLLCTRTTQRELCKESVCR